MHAIFPRRIFIISGHSFSRVLLYGQEFSLTVWEVLVLSLVDLLAQDFLLAAAITFLLAKFLAAVRYFLGRSNLAAKTLIDRRFLV
jgi:meckelin